MDRAMRYDYQPTEICQRLALAAVCVALLLVLRLICSIFGWGE